MSAGASLAGRAARRGLEILLGRHPRNTIFNFNWVNVRPMVRAFERLEPLFRGVVLDVGAGSSPYHGIVGTKARMYVAVDYPAALPPRESRPIGRIGGAAERLPVAAECADSVFCTQVLSQVASPLDALHEMRRVLKHGGHAVISVPHVAPVQVEPYEMFRFTPDGLRRLAVLAGLDPLETLVQGQMCSAFALCLAMSLVLTRYAPGRPMRVSRARQVVFAPLIGLVNAVAWVLDRVLPFNRTPSNFILVARKP